MPWIFEEARRLFEGPFDLSAEFQRLSDEFAEDCIRDLYGLGPKSGKKRASQYSSHSNITALPEDPQERWSQHMDRMRRGKRLTGDGREIDEERP